MKRILAIGVAAAMSMAACVPLSEMETLEAQYNQQSRQYALVQQELEELREENASLTRMNQALSSDMVDVSQQRETATRQVDSLTRRIEQMRQHYDTTMENYVQEVAGKSRDLTRAQNLLTARNRELAERERELQTNQMQLQQQMELFQLQRSEFQAREAEFRTNEAALLARQQELQQAEAATRAQLDAKERELDAVRTAVTNALVGFTDKGLNVETRDGKVYISMDNKLLFPPASWTVSKDGVSAIRQLAGVLEQDSTLNIMVEGHTDNDAYRGSTAVKDNWDLSVMRATAIVKLLLQNGSGINPARIQACGHGEFAPKVPNDSPEHKAMNRRTEIIITPNIEGLLQSIGQ